MGGYSRGDTWADTVGAHMAGYGGGIDGVGQDGLLSDEVPSPLYLLHLNTGMVGADTVGGPKWVVSSCILFIYV